MAASKTSPAHALDVLIQPDDFSAAAVTVLAGPDGYLRHEVRRTLIRRRESVGGDDPLVELMDGKRAELRDVLDALAERSLFGGDGNLVVVEDADPLIKRYRPQWEEYAASPARGATLIFEVAQWPSNTRLAKEVAQTGLTIDCHIPDRGQELSAFQRRLKKWLALAASRDFAARITAEAIDLLLERLPPEPGLAYQEIAKLSLWAKPGVGIDVDLVREHVGNWRARRTWDMLDAAADGNAAEALGQLDRLLAAGEQPLAILPQIAATLRHFATAARLFQQAEEQGARLGLREALEQAGVPRFKLADAERQIKQIGRARALQLLDWLLAADLDMKGHNSSPDRARRVLELLVVRLSKAAAPAAGRPR
jgi:DNA polymerase-3 subunit delta